MHYAFATFKFKVWQNGSILKTIHLNKIQNFGKMATEKNLIDFTQFPLTHELIFKKILFYSGGIMSEDSKR